MNSARRWERRVVDIPDAAIFGCTVSCRLFIHDSQPAKESLPLCDHVVLAGYPGSAQTCLTVCIQVSLFASQGINEPPLSGRLRQTFRGGQEVAGAHQRFVRGHTFRHCGWPEPSTRFRRFDRGACPFRR
jgi:hypothetical protein